MQNLKLSGLAIAMLASFSGVSSAAITQTTTFTLDTVVNGSSLGGKSHLAPTASGNCVGGGCYIQSGPVTAGTGLTQTNTMVLGVVDDPNIGTEHLHTHVHDGNGNVGYHSDSAGFFVRASDSSAFSLLSLELHAPINSENPDSGVNDGWAIRGFSSALNTDLATGNGTYTNQIAYQFVANGFEGTVLLNDAFSNIAGFWIHYKGYPFTPFDPDYNPDTEVDGPLTAKAFAMELDNVKLATAGTTNPSQVPVPAAVWLFGSGLLGLVSFGKKRAGNLTT
jgi:hypothetical protein